MKGTQLAMWKCSQLKIATIFQGVEGGGIALQLNEVTTASIIRSEFLFNG